MALGYLLFIVYGSLLPFQFHSLPFSIAWANFQHIPLLELGVENRADLVANLLLYIPFGLLLCAAIAGTRRDPLLVFTGALVSLLSSAAVALSIEFTQQFFAPRTVSLNDIFAELAGSLLGITLWFAIGTRLAHLIRSITGSGPNARSAILVSYGLAYIVLGMFPYDFLLSIDEWRQKLSSANVGWLIAPVCEGGCLLRLVPEALLVAPLAALFFPVRQQHILVPAAITGALLGVLIEGLQLMIASGISQGASILSRSLGMMLGAGMVQSAPDMDWRMVRHYARPVLASCLIPYLGALAWANGLFSGPWSNLSEAGLKLGDIHFLPFYYHYFTTETIALLSLLSQAALYFPVGAGIWLWHWGSKENSPAAREDSGRVDNPIHRNAWPALAAGMLASIMETGKLFVPAQHPDPTNILIAAAGAASACWLLNLLLGVRQAAPIPSHRPTPPPPSLSAPSAPSASYAADNEYAHSTAATVIGATAICLSIGAAATSPLGPAWVSTALIAYILLLWWQPGLWLICALAMLPLLDLSAWSGRLFWTEYDTVLLATIGASYLRLRPGLFIQPALTRPALLLLLLFGLSMAASLAIGLFPLAPFDHNAFANYNSSYNALRGAKGPLFAIALIPLLSLERAAPARTARKLAIGVTLGLAGTVAYILWERATFPGLFNFETDYRITGPFPGMHIGGAYIEAFLTAALPFVALFAWHRQRLWPVIFAIGLYGLGAYSIMVTFSRGGQVAFALSTFVLLAGFARLSLRGQAGNVLKASAAMALAGMAIAITWPVISGKYSQSRWAAMEQDFGSRTAHWKDAVNIVRSHNASFFGLGLGTFPSAYYWNSNAPSRTATYGFVTEQGNSILRLGSGDPLYLEQTVKVVPGQQYTLSMDLRPNSRNVDLAVTLCEKAILYSYTCTVAPLQSNEAENKWMHHEMQMDTRGFGPLGSRFQRPVKLSLYNSLPGTVVDVDNVTLKDMQGNNLVHNSDFSSGMHHWFFSTDNYLPWHVENLFLSVYFEQGWLGLLLFLALIGYAITTWLPRAWKSDSLSLTLVASFTAFIAVGTLNSWADEPRLSFLFYLLLIAGLMANGPSARTCRNEFTQPFPAPDNNHVTI